MHQLPGTIVSHTLEPLETPALVVQLSQPLELGAGQFMLAFHPHEPAAARSRLFPIRMSPDGVIFDHIPTPAWLPGQMIELLGPLGNTFHPPPSAQNWFLLSLGHHPERIFPLLDQRREHSASVAFWSKTNVPGLAADIERPISPEDALDWAEFIAIELPDSSWPMNFSTLHNELLDRKNTCIQVLMDVPTPCGFGGCQACAVPEHKGWSLACQKGLVRNFEEIRD